MVHHPSHQPRGDAPARLAWRSRWAHLRLWLTFAVALPLDLLTKYWAVQTIGDPTDRVLGDPSNPDPIVLIPDHLVLVTESNPGAVAGLFSGQTAFLLFVSALATVVLLWIFATSAPRQRLVHVTLGLLLAGALGNMYDRLFNGGLVIDFIKVDLGFWPFNPWPIFNLADIFLCLGVGLLLLGLTVTRHRDNPDAPPRPGA